MKNVINITTTNYCPKNQGKKSFHARVLFLLIGTLVFLNPFLFAQRTDLGQNSFSSLKWQQIAHTYQPSQALGLTTDNKMYAWGINNSFTIHTRTSGQIAPLPAYTPHYIPSPAGETVVKVGINYAQFGITHLCLTQSGKLYGWGVHSGLMTGTASGWTAISAQVSDSLIAKRTPMQLTIAGETQFVDFAIPPDDNYWVAISATGKAYTNGEFISGTSNYAFATIPMPAGVNTATFKYVKAWPGGMYLVGVYLKGNDNKIYYTGSAHGQNTGISSRLWYYLNGNMTTDSGTGPGTYNLRTDVPVEVPFPAGEDIQKISMGLENTFALSTSGKVYGTGVWRGFKIGTSGASNWYYSFPLKNAPTSTELKKNTYQSTSTDTTYLLRSFVELAAPASGTKYIDVESLSFRAGIRNMMVVTDNNHVYWSGKNDDGSFQLTGNYLEHRNPFNSCRNLRDFPTVSPYTWEVEAINFEGAIKIFSNYSKQYIISKSNTGYFVGFSNNPGDFPTGQITTGSGLFPFPTPIANEQLDICNTAKGPASSGPVSGVGAIDCSKTKLYPAPVQGVPSQTTLVITINVTTAGSFSPLSVSGSGMSLANGISSISTTTTGVQRFYIPLHYDGSSLTNNFQFTIGQAGSCSADLTQNPTTEITDVWSLNNCSAITPGVLSK